MEEVWGNGRRARMLAVPLLAHPVALASTTGEYALPSVGVGVDSGGGARPESRGSAYGGVHE